MPPKGIVLSQRTLNRTLLARQGLLARERRPASELIEWLVGLQAQEPIDPYVALWTRIEGFDPLDLSGLLERREAVRMGTLRGTLHLVTAADCLRLDPVLAGNRQRAWRSSPFAKRLVGVDVDAVVAAGREILEREPRSPVALGEALAVRWPDRDRPSLAYACRILLPLVQVPPRGLWQRTGRTVNTTATAWLGVPMGTDVDPAPLIRRYLAAFGPATPADVRTWSWLTGAREVLERLRPTLRTYRDESGRELFDLPEAPIADPELPAPVRFLPQYDNVFLSHADRARISGAMSWGFDFLRKGVILVDGEISGAWRVAREAKVATMTIEPGRRLTPAERRELDDEAERLGAFLDPDGPRSVVLVPPD
jgi:Winged helix DNA-binding domain